MEDDTSKLGGLNSALNGIILNADGGLSLKVLIFQEIDGISDLISEYWQQDNSIDL